MLNVGNEARCSIPNGVMKMSDGLNVEALLNDEPVSFLEIMGIGILDIAIPIVAAVCLLVASISLRRASTITNVPSFRFLSNAFAWYFSSLAIPVVSLFLMALVLEDVAEDVSEHVFDLMVVIPLLVGTVYLVLGTTKLRSEANAA